MCMKYAIPFSIGDTLDNLHSFTPDVYRATQRLYEMAVSVSLGNDILTVYRVSV